MLVYEEAHKYVPNHDLAKYRVFRESIERIAKKGRKYDVPLMLASQRVKHFHSFAITSLLVYRQII